MGVERILESYETFRDREIIYCGIRAAILYFEKHNPENSIVSSLWNAQAQREEELKAHYAANKYRERSGG